MRYAKEEIVDVDARVLGDPSRPPKKVAYTPGVFDRIVIAVLAVVGTLAYGALKSDRPGDFWFRFGYLFAEWQLYLPIAVLAVFVLIPYMGSKDKR